MLKRFSVILLTLLLLFSFTGCEDVNLTIGNSSDGTGVSVNLKDLIPSDLENDYDLNDYDNFEDYEDYVDEDNNSSSMPNSSSSSKSENSSSSNSDTNNNTVPATKYAVGKDGKKITLVNAVKVANGTTPMDKGLNFSGKTFTMAVTTEPIFKTNDFSRLISAFETRYNCKINITTLDFNNYSNQVFSKMLSDGKSYDIIYMHGSKFPEMPISGLVEDLSPYITTADYDTGNGGIDIANSARFVYNGELNGVVAGEHAVYPLVMYYNKALFDDSGMEDPISLYNKGQWGWSDFINLNAKVKANKKLGDSSFSFYALPLSSGISLWDWVNGRPIINWMNDSKIQEKMDLAKSFYRDGICSLNYSSLSHFTSGNVYTTIEESQKYSEYAKAVKQSASFNNSVVNLGIAPIPQTSAEAQNGYPTGWLSTVCAGKDSSDPRVAVAFAKFWSTFEDTVADDYEMSASDKALCEKLISGNLALIHGNYSNSSQNTNNLFKWDVMRRITLGDNVSQTINNNISKINDCINYTLY